MAKKKLKSERVQTAFRFTPEFLERLDEYAEDTGQSRTAALEELVDAGQGKISAIERRVLRALGHEC